MIRAKKTVLLIARWLAVLVAGFVLLSASLFANIPDGKASRCDKSCAVRCPCCISRNAPARSSGPLAPVSPRVAVEKDFQLAPAIALLLAPAHDGVLTACPFKSDIVARSGARLYQRHCTYLI
jgi:hypothetical protein